MAVAAGARAAICRIPVPSFIRSVRLPHQASGVSASDPYASEVQNESKPSFSALSTCSSMPGGGPACQ